MELIASNIDGDDTPAAAGQQHVGEAAGRRADIKTVLTGRIDAEGLQRVIELETASRNPGMRGFGFDHGRVGD